MFKKRKGNAEKRKANEDNSGEGGTNKPVPKIARPLLLHPDEDHEIPDFGQKKPIKKQEGKSGKHSLRNIHFEDNDDEADHDFYHKKRKKNKINSAAVASIFNADTSKSNLTQSGHVEQPSSRYSKESLENLKQSQLKTNASVKNLIIKNAPDQFVKEELSDEFDQTEQDQIDAIKSIRHRKKIAGLGTPMVAPDHPLLSSTSQTGKSKVVNVQVGKGKGNNEFLTPKDVHMAEEGIQQLTNGIYTMNETDQDAFEEMDEDGESWIDNRLQNALGVDHEDYTPNLITIYKSQSNPEDQIPDTREVRGLKMAMSRSIPDYQAEIESEIASLVTQIKNSQKAIRSMEMDIDCHKKDIETASSTIQSKAPLFKHLLDFTQVIEDIGGMLDDEKQDKIDHLYYNFVEIEKKFNKNIQKLAILDEVNECRDEFTKDIKAAKSTLADIFKDVVEKYRTPAVFYAQIQNLYENYSPETGFPFDFDILDMIDFVTPYVQVEFIHSYELKTNGEANECPEFEKFVNAITDLCKQKDTESEMNKVIEFLSKVQQQIGKKRILFKNTEH